MCQIGLLVDECHAGWLGVIEMTNLLRGAWLVPALLAALFACEGCGGAIKEVAADSAPAVVNDEPVASTSGSADSKGSTPNIRFIMNRLSRPGGLSSRITQELKADPPPWEKIQDQSQELAQLASALGQNKPPRGSKDSWTKLALAYAESAAAVDRAARTKDRDATLVAQDELANTCNDCHREHRRMRGAGKGR
jgi:hypothetical protein